MDSNSYYSDVDELSTSSKNVSGSSCNLEDNILEHSDTDDYNDNGSIIANSECNSETYLANEVEECTINKEFDKTEVPLTNWSQI